MKELNIDEIRNIQLTLLDYFSNCCKENNLRYTLAGGSLLGAIRHRGYIPWDDDIDIMMPWPDYIKFQKINIDNTWVKLFSPDDKNYHLPFSYLKLCDINTTLIEFPNTKKIKYHVYIDIYPCHGLSTKSRINFFLFNIASILNKVYIFMRLGEYNKKYGSLGRRFLWTVVYLISKIINPSLIYKILQQIGKIYSFDNATLVGNLTCGYGKKEKFHKESFNLTEHLFEGKFYSCLTGYDEYLTNLYGNYLQLPPKEQQIKSHNFIAYQNM